MSYTGDCVHCGHCCTDRVYIPGRGLVIGHCEHLIMEKELGQPEATRCAIHDQERYGKEITIKYPGGSFVKSKCLSTYPRGQDAIPSECSYVYIGVEKEKPIWFGLYSPTWEK